MRWRAKPFICFCLVQCSASFEPFMCLDLFLETYQSFLFRVCFCLFVVVIAVICLFCFVCLFSSQVFDLITLC